MPLIDSSHLIGLRVDTVRGMHVGTVSGVVVETESHVVHTYKVKPRSGFPSIVLKGLMGETISELFVHHTDVVAITEEKMIVKDAVVSERSETAALRSDLAITASAA